MPDITPIVNVALVLLIVFMVVTPMIREGIEVETPEAEVVEQLSEAEQSVVLAVQADGTMYVNLKLVKSHTLESELALAYRGHEGKPVVIKGAQNLPYKDILTLMDICKGIGAPAVDLVARKLK
jgi:biopolymer transport protein ExbD